MQSFRGKAGRLQAFSRLDNEAGDNTNETRQQTPEPEKRREAPHKAMTTSQRQELAEVARLPVPKPVHRSLGHQHSSSQPHLPSAQQRNSSYPVNGTNGVSRDADQGDIFTGSQLGESFMHSGISTPHNEPADLEPEHAPPTPEGKNNIHLVRGPTRTNFDRGVRPSDNAVFSVGEDMLMKVVTGPRRHNPSHMNDGFRNGALNGKKQENRPYVDYGRPASPAQRQHKPALREVRVRNSHNTRLDDYDARDMRPGTPTFDTDQWQRRDHLELTTRFQDPNDDGTSTVHGGVQETPKASRMNPSPVRKQSELPAAPQAHSSQPSRDARDRKRRRESVDYDDMALNNMNYAELQNEPFDFDPSKATPHTGYGANGGNLSARLEQYRSQTYKEQLYLFRNLSIDDWETAGDWFADQFADIMHRLAEARRNKRRMIQDFENEAAAREEAVRQRSDAIDRKLAKMRQDGQRVVSTNET